MDKELLKQMAQELQSIKLDREIRIMEVCGTHTTEFFKTGVKDMFPEGLYLVDGPGCPVCVTANDYLDHAIALGKQPHCILTTFGDMIKVPSSYSSLRQEKSKGMAVEVVYSPMDALQLAQDNPDKEVVFLSVGFETTAPTEAVTVAEAKKKNIRNFSVLSGNKLTPPAVDALINLGEVNIDGFILPGHVSAIVGAEAWRFISSDYAIPSVIAGFASYDLILSTVKLITMITGKEAGLINAYTRVVKPEGNEHAQKILHEVYKPSDAHWRGIGVIPGSGLELNDDYSDFDAAKKFTVPVPEPRETEGCRCGELLRGLISPFDCPLFDTACKPESPVGPCMVSSEGPCAAYYKYGRK